VSEYDDIDEKRAGARQEDGEAPPEASVHFDRWSPWIWIIPVLAIFFVGWLVVRYGFFGGGDITVTFVEARGLDRYSPVRFRGAKVGTVQKIMIDKELKQVVVRISMDASMNHALRDGTRFWIVEPGIEGGGLGGLLSGTYVAIAPGEGERARKFAGLEYAPVLAPPEAGRTFILEASGVGGITGGAPVQFQGMRVGRILGAEYDAATGMTAVHAFVVDRYAPLVRENTRFWKGGALSVSLGGGGLALDGASLSSILSSPIEFYTPEVLPGAAVPQGTRFQLHDSRAAAIASADGPHLTYVTYFPGALRGLTPGTPVQMRGVQVGRVREVRLRYVAANATLETPVLLEIDPRNLELPVTEITTREELRGQMNEALGQLVQKGMRARLATSLVLPGASAVSLDIIGRPGTARLNVASDPPVIPAAGGGDGIGGALAAIGDVATTIRNLPLPEIADDLRSASRRINALVSDPVLDESLRRLDRSLTEVERAAVITRENVGPIAESLRRAATTAETAARAAQDVVAEAGEGVGPIVESLRNAAETTEEAAEIARGAVTRASDSIEPIAASLRNAATSAETAARRAEQLIGTSARQNYDLGALIKELTRAAEAVRALADYLTENPDALLKGRAK
jgi:paraquat-inducible protein B